jgi:hypothetical protein
MSETLGLGGGMDFSSLVGTGLTPGAINAAGIEQAAGPAVMGTTQFGPPSSLAPAPSTWGIPNSQWQQGAQAMAAGGRGIGQATAAQAASQARMPGGGGAPRQGNPNLLAAYIQSLQQKREAMLPKVPGLLSRQSPGGGGGGFGAA